ncbi:CS1-pili formation C-terminal domain-containing protein [Enterobacter hormaechei]|nr:CS1-pili formation C-terminal domain-containing protein [Enterobacter hormaechei]
MKIKPLSLIVKACLVAGVGALFIPACGNAGSQSLYQIDGVILPHAFSMALQNGMSLPLYLHLQGNQGVKDDQRIGSVFIMLDGEEIKIKNVELEDDSNNAALNIETKERLVSLKNSAFGNKLQIELTPAAELKLSLKELVLQLIVDRAALGTVLRQRGSDIGQSSVKKISSTLNYNLGVYNNQMRNGTDNTSSYLSYNSVTSLREHHFVLNGSFYGIGGDDHDSEIYKAMYERDFAGYRFAGGMLDTWNLQSLGPMTAISAGKIYGFSWGNEASSTVFDNSQSATPIVAFLPAAGEVHLIRDGRLLSVQNFAMGNHEVDTSGLPYGIYDVDVEIVVNGRVINKRKQRVNKLFSRGRGLGAPVAWQVWGGRFNMDPWYEGDGRTLDSKDSWLLGASASGSWNVLSWAATGYGYDGMGIAESRLTVPLTDAINVSLQNMAASDDSWSTIGSISAALPGGFSSVWLNTEKTKVGKKLRRTDADSRAIGGSLNLNALWDKLGTFSISYNNDRQYHSSYYNADYYQTIYTGSWGTLGLRLGMQRYSNGNDNPNTGKYFALDFSLPLGNWISTGMSNQNGYTVANVSARKQFDDGVIRTVGADISRAISGDTQSDKTMSGGAYAMFDTRYSTGTVNINSSADGYINTNITANGSLGWQGANIGASGRTDGTAGIIFNTGLKDDGKLNAKVNGRSYTISGKKSYLPLSAYNNYEIEIQNNKSSVDSYDIVKGRKNHLTLYPGNVAVIEPEIKQMVTVSGRIHAEDGTLLTNAKINNHIGRTRTDEDGEFVMDIDKKYPVISFEFGPSQTCEVDLELSKARGAVWVGDVVCEGLNSYVNLGGNSEKNES